MVLSWAVSDITIFAKAHSGRERFGGGKSGGKGHELVWWQREWRRGDPFERIFRDTFRTKLDVGV